MITTSIVHDISNNFEEVFFHTSIWEGSTAHEERGTPIHFCVIKEEQHG